MRAYVYILARLVLRWGHLPPEVVVAAVFAVPGIVGFMAGLPYLLNLVAGGLVSWWCTGIIREHVWPDVPPGHRRFLRLLRNLALMKRLGQGLRPQHRRDGKVRKGTITSGDKERRPEGGCARSRDVRGEHDEPGQ